MSQILNLNMENESGTNNYARSGKIMLTAIIILFIVIIIMIFLHILIRWYLLRARSRQQLRRSRHFRRQPFVFYVDPDAPSQLISAVSRGLDAAVISSLPTFNFSPKSQAVECAVCLSEFEEGETGRVLPKCNHSFHIDCIDMWFQSHSTCPLCRAPVEPPPVQVTRSEVTVSVCEPEPLPGSSYGEEVNRSEPGFSSSSCSIEKQSSFTDVVIEIPGRSEVESGCDSPSSFRSPMSRVMSLTRILSRERKPSVSPSSDCVAVNDSVIELESERGGRDETQ
ncbi:RING-H2 finger protein ATL2-like [Cicer arietinum]|uniref:RING-type E3 ubiquitin transferase n=1 Tax=Cicer arietinum TaxID=3827 RepID=A0A1S2YQ68_CICAR|nr:RING-H2 finger protein ATL2-like [Cicer arietinum]